MNQYLVVKEKSERYRVKREHKYRGSGIFILKVSKNCLLNFFFFLRSICAIFREKSAVDKATLNLDISKASR